MTRQLWTLAEVVAATAATVDLPPKQTEGSASAASGFSAITDAGGQAKSREDGPAGVADAIVTGVSIDTRTLAPGDLFVPLTDARDGHDFVAAAFERGAVAALARKSYVRKPGDGVLIRVDDPLTGLGRIGIAARDRLAPSARVIAVTGSAGKTGTKEMLRACLKVCASSPERVHAPEKSFNNHWGVPLTLARMPADTEFAVLEIGMNHAGEIRPLVKMVRPHVGIVTNVLPVHVGNFPDGEIGVANAKAEIFEGLEAGGTAIILRDSPHYDLLRVAAEKRGQQLLGKGKAGVSVVTFGWHSEAGVKQLSLSGEQANGTQLVPVEISRSGLRIGYDLGMLGQHLALNSLAVIAALDVLECDVKLVTSALASIRSAAGRGAREMLGSGDNTILLLDESYNANPASMAAALANLAATDPVGRRTAVMGDMLELAPSDRPHVAARYHMELLPALDQIDRVLCCGPMMRELYDLLPADKQAGWVRTSNELIALVLHEIGPGDAVMVKGSLGSRMAPIVDAIKKRFAPE